MAMTNKPKLTSASSRKITPKEAKQALVNGAMPILRDVLRLATGKIDEEGGLYGWDHKARQYVLDTLSPIIQSANDIQQLNAKSSQDIIGLISSGKCSIEEALNLMRLVQMEFEMTELRSLADKLDAAQEPNASEGKYSHG